MLSGAFSTHRKPGMWTWRWSGNWTLNRTKSLSGQNILWRTELWAISVTPWKVGSKGKASHIGRPLQENVYSLSNSDSNGSWSMSEGPEPRMKMRSPAYRSCMARTSGSCPGIDGLLVGLVTENLVEPPAWGTVGHM